MTKDYLPIKIEIHSTQETLMLLIAFEMYKNSTNHSVLVDEIRFVDDENSDLFTSKT
jgi:hypothetical protein